MFLYNLTLQRPSAIYFSVHGSFSAPRAIELVLGRQTSLELVRPDEQGHLKSLCFQEIYGIIRSLKAFRLTGAKRDYLLIGSDSGKITSGCRRIVPGEYLATDPKGRACMIGAIEKQKFVYVFNRDALENLTISSPLEAHKSSFICYDIIGLDVGFENPIFAALERAYDPPESPKTLVFYELDLGLNHVVRKLATPVEADAYKVLPVPGGRDGPGGVIVCSLQHIRYKTLQNNLPDYICSIPLREKNISPTERGLFFYLLCTELGDLFKLEMDCTTIEEEEEGSDIVMKEMRIRYLDSLPCPVNDMCILRNGFLFVASEYGNHGFYQFRSLGREQDFCCVGVEDSKWSNEPVYFSLHNNLENLLLIEEIESLAPLTCWQIGDFYGEGSPQIVVGSGRRHRGSWKTLRLGYRWTEMAVSELPGYPVGVFTVREQQQDSYDSYIIVSFVNASLVLSVGETVEEVSDSGFSTFVSTIFVQLFSNNSIVQVHAQGIRHIRPDLQTVHEWKPPKGLFIQVADGNASQLVIILNSKQLLYFELDETGMLTEIQEVELIQDQSYESSSFLPCVSIAPLVAGQSKASFVAVSDGISYYTRLYSLKKESCLKPISLQALDTVANSVLLIGLSAPASSRSELVLLIGSHSGIYIRALVDPITGALSEQQSRLVGTQPVRLQRIEIQGKPVALVVSSRSYLVYLDNHLLLQTLPIGYDWVFDHVVGFCSEQCPDGVIACCGSSLCILSFEEDRDLFQTTHLFHSDTQPSLYTPRRLVDREDILSSSITNYTRNRILTLECDQQIVISPQDIVSHSSSLRQTGYPLGPIGSWSCAIQQMTFMDNQFPNHEDPVESTSCRWQQKCEIYNSETKEYISSICCIRFSHDSSSLYLCVGVVMDYALQVTNPLEKNPTKDNIDIQRESIVFPRSEIRVYRWNETQWEYIHTTPIQDASSHRMEWNYDYGASHLSFHAASRYRNEIITTMASFQGHLLVAVGTSLRIATPHKITCIETCYDRIFLSDVQESVFLYRYSAADNLFLCIADDYLPKWCTTMCLLDYDTVAIGDKMGNISILRLPPEAGTFIEQDPTGGLLSKEAPHHFQLEACYYVGSVIQCLSKVEWTTGDVPLLFYGTLDGAIGVMIPLRSTLDMELFQALELQLREYRSPLCGRHHLAYRSYFFPVRHVIDGDLCEEFYRLSLEQQEKIVKRMDRSIVDVHRKLEDYRERIRYPYLPI
ncbi:Splicing factor 3B subunit 3 [Galdieria sulphuraria]|nr:Splicing factor 3B subunit 3 [Galdieria sulphuraria]